MSYEAYVMRKLSTVPSTGIADGFSVPASLFPHQSALTAWAIRRGRAEDAAHFTRLMAIASPLTTALYGPKTELFLARLFSRPANLYSYEHSWFAEKDGIQATRIFPLSDFSPRKHEAWERGYLMGRYGAVPMFSALPETASSLVAPSAPPAPGAPVTV